MLKTFTFAVLHFGVAFGIAYLLTGNIGISSAVALIEPLANTVVFYFHEKAWQRFGKKEQLAQAEKHPFPLHQCVGN